CFLFILLCGYLFFFFGMGSYSLKEPDEGRYAEIPREMVEQGNYLVPHLNYVRYFEKPPFFYWVTAGSYHLFGVNEWACRLPNALAALLCALSLYLVARKWFGQRTAFLSSLILISSFGFFAMARIVTTDLLFGVLLFAAILCFNVYYREGKESYRRLFYLWLALATLTKGPVSLILVGGTILIYLLTERRLAFLKELLRPKGILLYLLVAAPWFVAISVKETEFFSFFFIDQHVLRFLTSKHNRTGPVYYFIPVLLGGMLPWAVFLPRCIAELWRVKELRLFFIWSGVVLLFFSLSGSKLAPYILPVFPALSLILGYLFGRHWKDQVSGQEAISYVLLFAIIGLSGLAVLHGGLGQFVMNPQTLDIIKAIKGLGLGFAIVSGAIIGLLCLRNMRRYESLFVLLAGFSLSLIVLVMLHSNVLDDQRTAKALAETIKRSTNPAAAVVIYGSFEQTIPFYTGRRVYLADYTGELKMGAKYPDAKPFFLTKQEFQELLDSDKLVFCVVKEKRLDNLVHKAGRRIEILGCQNERCLISNQPYQSK
ncbi:MAG TPA: hypothetical protein DCR97_00925, partial [Deltaproteobacteria bacterium]|nr:hypothetical protein [Deltaproteobacteria bacterium]